MSDAAMRFIVPGTGTVSIHVKDVVSNIEDALYIVWRRLNENSVPDDGKRVGLQGYQTEPFEWCGIRFGYDARLGRDLVVAWHLDAVIPPATVLQPDGIAYCRANKTFGNDDREERAASIESEP